MLLNKRKDKSLPPQITRGREKSLKMQATGRKYWEIV